MFDLFAGYAAAFHPTGLLESKPTNYVGLVPRTHCSGRRTILLAYERWPPDLGGTCLSNPYVVLLLCRPARSPLAGPRHRDDVHHKILSDRALPRAPVIDQLERLSE